MVPESELIAINKDIDDLPDIAAFDMLDDLEKVTQDSPTKFDRLTASGLNRLDLANKDSKSRN